MDLKLGGIDIGVAVLYVVAFAIIGVLANRKVKTAKDFVSAGQSLTLPVVVGTTIATCLGASILFSNYQRIHAFGIDGLVWALAWYVGWMLMLPIAKRLRASGATSLPTFLEKRYNGKTRTISSVFVLVSAISTCASFFLAFGTMAQTLGICDMKTGTIVGAVVIVIFTVLFSAALVVYFMVFCSPAVFSLIFRCIFAARKKRSLFRLNFFAGALSRRFAAFFRPLSIFYHILLRK